MDYFYSGQIRQYIVQFMRIFSDIKVDNPKTGQARVPIVWGDPSWQVAQILKNNSANTMTPAPMFSTWITRIEMAPERRQDSQFVGTVSGIERAFDGNEYTGEAGNRFTVERYMPVPYTLTFQLDVWTTSTTTKLQILEQIMSIFNPAVQLQTNSNPFDWGNLCEVTLSNITYDNRNIGSQSDETRSVASLEFKIPIWISPPAKLKRTSLVERIITNVHSSAILSAEEVNSMLDGQSYDQFSGGTLSPDANSGNYGDPRNSTELDPHRDGHNYTINADGSHIDPGNHMAGMVSAPGNFSIKIGVDGVPQNKIVLLNSAGQEDPTLSWADLFAMYGNISAGNTKISLYQSGSNYETDDAIFGTVATDAANSNRLTFSLDVDSLPPLMVGGPVNATINPTTTYPNSGLQAPYAGQRYLLTSDMIHNPAWDNLLAKTNDIIEYNGSSWVTSFDSRTADGKHHTIDLSTKIRYTYHHGAWHYTYLGVYSAKHWKLSRFMK